MNKPCAICKTPAHVSNGHLWGLGTLLCYKCTLSMIKWIKARESAMRRIVRDDGESFADAATKSREIFAQEGRQLIKSTKEAYEKWRSDDNLPH